MTAVFIAACVSQERPGGVNVHWAATRQKLDDLLRDYYDVEEHAATLEDEVPDTSQALIAYLEDGWSMRVDVYEGTLDEPDYPAFEWAVEFDEADPRHYYDDAEAELSKGGGAAPTLRDIKARAAVLAAKDAEILDVHPLCPACGEYGCIVEVDESTRWNELTIEFRDGDALIDPYANAHTGDGNYEFVYYLCTTSGCYAKLSAPDGFEINDWF